MDKQDKLIQDVNFLFGKFITKYPFIEVYYGYSDRWGDCLLVSTDYEIGYFADEDFEEKFWEELNEIEDSLSVTYEDKILFTSNEELFDIIFDKKKVEPFVLDNMTLKEKIEEIVRLIQSIQDEYKMYEGILVSNVIHPRNFTQEQNIDLCTINYKISDYDNVCSIQINYRYGDEWRNTFFNEYNESMVASKSADSIINALNMAKIHYYRANDVLHRTIRDNGDTRLKMALFNQLFQHKYLTMFN